MQKSAESRKTTVARRWPSSVTVIESVSIEQGEGFAGKVAQQGRPLLVADLESDTRFRRKRRPRFRSNSFLIVPVPVNGRVMAVINLADKAGGLPLLTGE